MMLYASQKVFNAYRFAQPFFYSTMPWIAYFTELSDEIENNRSSSGGNGDDGEDNDTEAAAAMTAIATRIKAVNVSRLLKY